jgi:uncharacterized membrane protein YkvA (DUF1232 family)
MNLGTFLLGFVVAVLVIGLVVLGLVLFVIWRKKIPVRGAAALLAAAVYFISPIDAIPEGLFGPAGLLDDAGVLALAWMYAQHVLRARRAGLPVSAGLYNGSRELLHRKPVNRRQP